MLKVHETSQEPRETACVAHGKPICYQPTNAGIRVFLKGTKKHSYVVRFEDLFRWGEQGSVSIKARPMSDSQLAKVRAALDARELL